MQKEFSEFWERPEKTQMDSLLRQRRKGKSLTFEFLEEIALVSSNQPFFMIKIPHRTKVAGSRFELLISGCLGAYHALMSPAG
jgi:hypothetical protein